MVNVDEATSLLVTQTQLAHSVNDKERDSATITIKLKSSNDDDDDGFNEDSDKNREKQNALTNEEGGKKRSKKKKKSGAQRRNQKKGPAPLFAIVSDYPEIFSQKIAPLLNGNEIKLFAAASKQTFKIVKNSGILIRERFWMHEFTTTSQLEWAFERYSWGQILDRKGKNGEDITMNQEYFIANVVLTANVELVKWCRERKKCAWDWQSTYAAGFQNHLDVLKYLVENGCTYDAMVCLSR